VRKIPKKIHYCWFGGNEKNELVRLCIQSWEDKLDGYEFIEWNETNFPINDVKNDFVKLAYKNGSWAFVSDYVRLWVLLNEGGIYFDTDVEVIKNIDLLLANETFIGFEDDITLASCVIGSVPNSNFINEIFMQYSDLEYKSNMSPNVRMITDIAISRGLKLNGNNQIIRGNVKVYSKDYFSPKNYITGESIITKNSVCIHHFNGSWLKNHSTFKNKLKYYFYKSLGQRIYSKLVLIKRMVIGC
jgi:hypothetical protein